MTEPNANDTEGRTRVAFDLTPEMSKEVDRILGMTDLNSKPEVFRRAFTLLRIHVDAAARGQQVYLVSPDHPNDKYIITLPFNVRSRSNEAE